MSTEAQLKALSNSELASGTQIPALKHRTVNNAIIEEMYDAQSRGNVLSGVQTATSLASGDEVFVIRSGEAYLLDADELGFVSTLADLTDVNIPAPSNDQVLAYNFGTSKWMSKDVSSLSSVVSITGTATTNQMVKFTGLSSIGNSIVSDDGTTVNIAGNLSVDNNLTVNEDILVNGLTVGRGAGNIDTNTAFGLQALASNTTGNNNTAFGRTALFSNTTAEYNTAVGNIALFNNTTGNNNNALGHEALFNNTTGNNNTALGHEALFNNTTGADNTALGHEALFNNTTGADNNAIGSFALYDLNGGNDNTALGYNTGRNIITGSANTIIGANVTGLPAALSNTIIIADGDGNQRIRVDSSGNVGIKKTDPAVELDVDGEIRASNGILFGTDTAAANALNDYEEGTFTAEVADAATGGNTASVGAIVAKYIKVGRLVTVSVQLLNINTSGMTGGNNLFFRGLPFTTSEVGHGAVNLDKIKFTGNYVVSQVSSGATYVRFINVTSQGNDTILNVSAIDTASSDIFFTLTYEA